MASWDVIYKATADFADLMQAAARARDELKRLEAAARSEGAAEADAALKAAAAHQADARAIDQQRQALEKLAAANKAANVQAFGGRSSMDEHLADLDRQRQRKDQLNRAEWMGFSSPQQAESFRQQAYQAQLLRNRAAQMGYNSPDQYLNYLDQERKRIDAQSGAIKARSLQLQDSAQAYTGHANAMRQAHESAQQLGTTASTNIQGYAAAVQGLPDSVSTQAVFVSGEALRDVAVYNAALDSLPDTISTQARLDTGQLDSDVVKARGALAMVPSSQTVRERAAAAPSPRDLAAGVPLSLPQQRGAVLLGSSAAADQAALAAASGVSARPAHQPPAELPPDLASASRYQLQQQARTLGVKGSSQMAKPDLISAITDARAALAELDKASASPRVKLSGAAAVLADVRAVRAAIRDLSGQIANPNVHLASTDVLSRMQAIHGTLGSLGNSGPFKGLDVQPAGLEQAKAQFTDLGRQADRAFSDIKFKSGSSSDQTTGHWRMAGSIIIGIFRGMKASSDDAAGHVTGTFQQVAARITAAFQGLTAGGLLSFFTNLAQAAAQGASAVTSKFGPMTAILAAVIQLLPALVAGFGALGTVLVAMPQAVASLAIGMLALKEAVGPVLQALSAYGQVLHAQQAASANPVQTAMQLAQQQNAVANAYYGVQQAAYQARLSQMQNAHAVSDSQFQLGQAIAQASQQQITAAHAVADAQFGVQQADYASRMSRINDAHAVADSQFALRQAVYSASQSQIQDAHAVSESQFSLRQAQFSANIQQMQGSLGLQSAQHGLAEANYSVSQSQYQLNIAWQQARMQLQQLELTVSGASLNLRGAQLALEQAQQNYAQVMAQSTATALDRAQAAYAIQQAEFNLKQVMLSNKDNEQQLQNVRKYGVNQVFGVTAAQHALTDAVFSQVQAQKQLIITQKETANAQIQAAHAVTSAVFSLQQALSAQQNQHLVGIHTVSDAQFALWSSQQQQANDFIVSQHNMRDAQFSLAQAIYEQSHGRISAAHAVADAQFALTQAQMAQSEGYITSAHDQSQASFALKQALTQEALGLPAIASAQANLATAMANLGPAARLAVHDLIPLARFFADNKTVGEAFFSQVDPALSHISRILGPLNYLLTSVGSALGHVTAQLISWFERLAQSPAWKMLTRGTVSIISSLGDALLHVVDGFTKIAEAAQPFTTWLFAGIDHLAKRFDTWATNADKAGSNFRRWLREVRPALDAFNGVLDAVVKGFATIAGGPMGSPGSLQSLHSFVGLMNTLSKTVLPDFFKIIHELAKPQLLNSMLLLVSALSNLLLTIVSTPGFQLGFQLFIRLFTDLVNLLAKVAGFGPVGQILGGVAGAMVALAAVGGALKFTGILTLITHLKEVRRLAEASYLAVARLLNKLPGVNLPTGKGGGSTGPASAAEQNVTAGETMLKASENMLTAAGRMETAGTDQEVAATGEQTAAAEMGAAGTKIKGGFLSGLGGAAIWAVIGVQIAQSAGDWFSQHTSAPVRRELPAIEKDFPQNNSPGQRQFQGFLASQGWFQSLVNGAVTAYTKVNEALNQHVGVPAMHFFTRTIPDYFKGLVPWWDSAWSANMQSFRREIWVPVSGFFTSTVPGWFHSVSSWWSSSWSANMQSFRQQIWQPVSGFFTSTVPGWFTSVGRWWSGLWKDNQQSFHQQVWQPLSGFFTGTVPGWFGSVGRWWSGLWKDNQQSFRQQVWQPFAGFFTSTIPGWFDSIGRIWSRLWSTGWTDFRSHLLEPMGNWFSRTLPNAIENAFKNSVNWVIRNVINRAIGVINDVTGIVGIPKIHSVQQLAAGGNVMGSVGGSGDHDTQHAILTPGEWVIRKPARMALERKYGPEFLPGFVNRADEVLGYASGGPVGGRTSQPGSGGGPVYRNPLRDVHPLSPARVDMGVDYIGSGNVYAVGAGTIENTAASGWPGRSFIAERLADGQYAGKLWYAAENIAPKVHVGQRVGTDTVIGHMYNTYPFSEWGWAASPHGLTEAAAHNQQAPGGDPGGRTSAFGWLAAEFLHSLGAPLGIRQGQIYGNTGNWAAPGGGFLGFLQGIGSGLSKAGGFLSRELGLGARALLRLAGKGAEQVFNAGWDHVVTPLASRLAGGNKTITGSVMRAVLASMRKGVDTRLTDWDKTNGSGQGFTPRVPVPANASVAQEQAYARGRLGSFGWGASQMPYLIDLWDMESGWNRLARNPSSGAYGIPQALPPGKMGAAANPPQSSSAAQMDWGMHYIKDRYGSPAAADSHEHAYHWYAEGGPVAEQIPLHAQGGPVGLPAMRMFTGGDVISGIRQATTNVPVRESMALGSWLESRWDPNAAGDHGTSFGPFQIHLPSHPGVTRRQAEDPYWAARFMLGPYHAGVTRTGTQQQPYDAEQAAYLAEKPAKTYYASQGAASVSRGWAATLKALGIHSPHRPPEPPRPPKHPDPNSDAAQRWAFYSGRLGSLARQEQIASHDLTGANLHALVRQHKLRESDWATAYSQQLILGHQQALTFGLTGAAGDFARLWSNKASPQDMTVSQWDGFRKQLGLLTDWEEGPNYGGKLPPQHTWAWERQGTGWPHKDKHHATWKSLGLPAAPGHIRPSPAELRKLQTGRWRTDNVALGSLVTAEKGAERAWRELWGPGGTLSGGHQKGPPYPHPGTGPPLPGPGGPSPAQDFIDNYIGAGGPGKPVFARSFAGGGSVGDVASMFAFGGPVMPRFAPAAPPSSASPGSGELPPREVSEAAAAVAGSRIGVQVNGGITVNNPVPERAGESIAHRVQRLAFLAGRGIV